MRLVHDGAVKTFWRWNPSDTDPKWNRGNLSIVAFRSAKGLLSEASRKTAFAERKPTIAPIDRSESFAVPLSYAGSASNRDY